MIRFGAERGEPVLASACTQEQEILEIQVDRTEREARLTVEDDGPGVPGHDREAALKPFVRLERSRTTKGSGLGLSIVAAIAARHGADLTLEDAAPGLRVRLTLPLADRPAAPIPEILPPEKARSTPQIA